LEGVVASRIELFAVTVTAGTLQTAPVTTNTTFNVGEVEQIEILVPPGNAGLLGFQVRHSGSGVFPREDAKFIIAAGEVIKWPVEGGPTAGRWQIRAYNTDVNDHVLYVRYLVREVGSPLVVNVDPLDIQQPAQLAPAVESELPPIEVPAL
jgi:hypothetical protein